MLFPNGLTPVQITLYKNIPFDNKYEHHLFRDVNFTDSNGVLTPITMEDFLNVKTTLGAPTYPKHTLVDTFNFDYANGLVTRIVLNTPNTFTDSNYMLVKSGGINYYFFITSVIIKNSDANSVTAQFELELDVLATYGKDFFENVRNVPIFTERKHCQRFSLDNKIYCGDLITSEDVTINCKPNIIKEVKNHNINLGDNQNHNLIWVYITRELYKETSVTYPGIYPTKIGDIQLPVTVIAIPLCDIFTIRKQLQDSDTTVDYVIHPQELLSKIFDETNVYQIKFSTIPPFDKLEVEERGASCTLEQGINENNETFLTLYVPRELSEDVYVGQNEYIYIGSNKLMRTYISPLSNVFCIINQKVSEINYYSGNIDEYNIGNVSVSNDKNIDIEPKMLFYPCRKYELFQRFGSPVELHPELVACSQPLDSLYTLKSYATASFQSTTISTYIRFNPNLDNFTKYYTKVNKGLITNCDYNFPCGEDALKVFAQTQSASYTNQTIGKVIGGVLGIIGGVAAIGGSGGSAAPLGAIAIASGATTIATSIGGAVAKYVDLENTPDKMSNVGTSIFQDMAVEYESTYSSYFDINLNPRLIISELSPSEKEIIYDYFYHFGYNVQRQCYFNSDLRCASNGYTTSEWVDKRLLTRTLFNYVKFNENIRNKMLSNLIPAYDMPPVVVDKINAIFNNGITLWTLFNIRSAGELTSNAISGYLLKEKYENAEIDL